MSTTPLRAYPYPALSAAPDVPADISALALALDADVGAFHEPWAPYTVGWTATSGTPSPGTGGSLLGVRTLIGKTVHGRVVLSFGTSLASGTGPWAFTLPVPALVSAHQPIGNWTYYNSASDNRYTGMVVTSSTTTVQLVYGNPTTGVDGNTPTTHSATDKLYFVFTYQAA